MRLAALLGSMADDELERLGATHLGEDEHVSRASLCSTLETVLRSYAFVRKFVSDRFPPTFSILETLLNADKFACPASDIREVVESRTRAIVERVTGGDLVGRDSGLRLYRRVLLEARRNDMVLDASETAILGVLRRELGIRSVEHFLVEHHPDFQELWSGETAFLEEMHALRSCGLVFAFEGKILLADEVVTSLRQTLGLETSAPARRRLFAQISGAELGEILSKCLLRTSGTRDEKLERLFESYVPPSEVLHYLSLQSLRDIARDSKTSVAGSKDELVERIVDHYLHDGDQVVAPIEERPRPSPEPRALAPDRFRALFGSLRSEDLTDVLAGIESPRITGAKEKKVALLSDSPYSETTLLEQLTKSTIEELVSKNRLRVSGSKRELVDRLVDYFRTIPDAVLGLARQGDATSRAPLATEE